VVARSGGTRRIQISGADDRAPVVEPSTDIVVAPGSADSVGSQAVGADDLAALIRYGIAVEQRDDICERHLGAPPAALDVPLRVRIRNRLWERAHPAVYIVGALLCLLVAASAVGWVCFGLGSNTGDPAEPADTASLAGSDRPPSSTVVPASASGQSRDGLEANQPGSSLPPGVGPGGVEDNLRLDTAHSRAIGNRSYTLRVDLYWPRSGRPGAERVHRNMDFSVAADGRYLLQTTVRALGNNSTHVGQADLRVYHDGRDWYVAERTDDGVEYRRVSGSQQPPIAVPEPTVLRNHLASWYLLTSVMNTTATSRGTRME